MEWKKILIIVGVAILVILGIWGVIVLVDALRLRREQKRLAKRTGLRCKAVHEHRTPTGGIVTTRHCHRVKHHPKKSHHYRHHHPHHHHQYYDGDAYQDEMYHQHRYDGMEAAPITPLEVVPNDPSYYSTQKYDMYGKHQHKHPIRHQAKKMTKAIKNSYKHASKDFRNYVAPPPSSYGDYRYNSYDGNHYGGS